MRHPASASPFSLLRSLSTPGRPRFQTPTAGTAVAALVAVMLLPLLAPAAAQPVVNVRGHAAASWLRSPTGQGMLVDPGYEVGLGAGIEVYDGFELTVAGTFARFAGNEDELVLNLANVLPQPSLRSAGGDVETWSGSLGLRYTYQNETPAHPYIETSVGYSSYTAQRADVFRTVDGTETIFRRAPETDLSVFGYQMAFGVVFRISERYSFFVEPRLVTLRTFNERTVLACNSSTCPQDADVIGLVTNRDQVARFVPVRLGIQFRPWGTRPLEPETEE